MSRIFISHNSADNAITAEFFERFKEQGHHSVYIDFDPDVGIPAGRDWEQDLYRELRACQALVILCSPHSMNSSWCFAEVTHAKALGKPVFPVKVSDCDILSILTSLQVIDWTVDKEEAYQRLWRGLKAAGVDAVDDFTWDGTREPYPGLLSFTEKDAAIFFGRDDEIQGGLESLNSMQRFGGAQSLLVTGSSGSGKSSLVRAGLVPRLKRSPEQWFVLDAFRPKDNPLHELALAFGKARERSGNKNNAYRIEALLRIGGDGVEELLSHTRKMRNEAGFREASIVIVIDQAEELFTRGDASSDEFLAVLRILLEAPDSPFLVVWTLRSDYLDDFRAHPEARQLSARSLSIGPMETEDIARVIRGPAELAGVTLEPGLTEHMIHDADTDDGLPLLAFSLRELYEQYGWHGQITLEHYNKLDGITGSLAKVAEEIYKSPGLEEQERHALRSSFLAMARIDEEGEIARRPAHRNELPRDAIPALEHFIDARLLVAGSEEVEGGGEIIEVAHEALFRSWRRLKGWLEEDREFLLWQRRLGFIAQEWDDSGRDKHDLTEARHHDIQTNRRKHPEYKPEGVEAEFVRACRGKHRRRVLRRISIILLLAVVGVGSMLWAEVQRKESKSRTLASRALHMAENPGAGSIDLGLLLAALAFDQSANVDNRSDLLEILQRTHQTGGFLRKVYWEHLGPVSHLQLGAEGKTLYSGGVDGKVNLIPVDGMSKVNSLVGIHRTELQGLAVSARDRILTASADVGLQEWEASSGEPQNDPSQSEVGAISAVAYSAEGDMYAVGTITGYLVVNHIDSMQQLIGARVDELRLDSLVFDPSGRMIAAAGESGDIHVWSIASGEPLFKLEGNGMPVNDLAFHPGGLFISPGDFLFTVDDLGVLQSWDLTTGKVHKTELIGGDDNVGFRALNALALFVVNEFLYAAIGDDTGELAIWEIDDFDGEWKLEGTLQGHTDAINSLVASPDGEVLASAGDDGSIRIWQVSLNSPLLATYHPQVDVLASPRWSVNPATDQLLFSTGPQGLLHEEGEQDDAPQFEGRHEGWVAGLEVDDAGKMMAAVGRNGDISLWNIDARQLMGKLPGNAHIDRVERLALSPVYDPVTGEESPWRSMLSADINGGVVLWDLSGEFTRHHRLEGHRSRILDMGYNHDGRYAATADEGGRVILWDIPEQERLGEFMNHPMAVNALAFSPVDGLLASVGDDSKVRFWDVTTQTRDGLPLGEGGSPDISLAFSPDGRYLAVGSSDTTISIWDVEERTLHESTLLGHTASVEVLTFHPTLDILASADADGAVKLWDLETALPLGYTFRDRQAAPRIERLHFTADGMRLFAIGPNDFVNRWRLDGKSVACELAGRNLTREEWKNFMGDLSVYRQVCPEPAELPTAGELAQDQVVLEEDEGGPDGSAGDSTTTSSAAPTAAQ